MSQTIAKDDTTETTYALAYDLYQNGHYEKANKLFTLLTLANPKEKKFWMGTAASLQSLGQYDIAITNYAMAASIDMNDPWPHHHAAECYIALNKTAEAKNALNEAERLLGNSNEQLKQQIKTMRQAWN